MLFEVQQIQGTKQEKDQICSGEVVLRSVAQSLLYYKVDVEFSSGCKHLEKSAQQQYFQSNTCYITKSTTN